MYHLPLCSPVHLLSTTLLRQFTMHRRITSHSSRVAETYEKLLRHRLRKRTAHHCGRFQKSVTGFLSLEQYIAKVEDLQQHTGDLVEEKTFDGNEEPLEDALLKATSTIVPKISNVPNVTMPEINVAVARMYDCHRPRKLHDSSPVAPNDLGKLSASHHFRVNSVLPAAMNDNHR
jgi:hypothetical protein